MSEWLFCKDCKHSSRSLYHVVTFMKFYECKHPTSYVQPKISPVTGPVTKGWYNDCGHMRSHPEACGREGRHWSPKNTKKFLFTILKQEN